MCHWSCRLSIVHLPLVKEEIKKKFKRSVFNSSLGSTTRLPFQFNGIACRQSQTSWIPSSGALRAVVQECHCRNTTGGQWKTCHQSGGTVSGSWNTKKQVTSCGAKANVSRLVLTEQIIVFSHALFLVEKKQESIHLQYPLPPAPRASGSAMTTSPSCYRVKAG